MLSLVIGLGLLIVAGVVLVIVTLVHRALAPRREMFMSGRDATAPSSTAIEQPAGTRILSVAAGSEGDWLAMLVTGGSRPDRVLIVDPHAGRLLGVVQLTAPAAPHPTH